MRKTVGAVGIGVHILTVAHHTADACHTAVNITVFIVMNTVNRVFTNTRTIHHKCIHRRQAHAFGLRILVHINKLVCFAVNTHHLFKLRINTCHILNNKTVFKRLNIVAVGTGVRYRISDQITLCNIHNIFCVIAHNPVVCNSLAVTAP